MNRAEFDRFAATYDSDLAKALAVTGEDRDFYARGRIDCTAQCVSKYGLDVRRILDFGCGDGRNLPILVSRFKPHEALGVDVSSGSIAVARESIVAKEITLLTTDQWTPDGNIDLAYVNGVFHHIPPAERHDCLISIRRALKHGGLFAFWENNPWNPGTRYVMSRCKFDKDITVISPRNARTMLSQAGFKILRVDSIFYFPHQLQALRPAERWLRALPLGGQYQVLCAPADHLLSNG